MIVSRAAAEFIVHAEHRAGEACPHMLFPHWAELAIEELVDRGSYVLVRARADGGPVSCPECGVPARLHGHYRRLLQDLPAGGRQVLISLTVRRLRCRNSECSVRTFADPLAGLARRHARNTSMLRDLLERLALALAGRAGSRLLSGLGVTASRDTLIRLVRALPDPEFGQVTVLGVDDWAKRRGQSYATVLVDMDTHRPIDVLDDRQAETFAAWLREHPGVQVICRDRAGAYAEGARTGAPDAIEVADRWHLWKNLCDATEKTVRAHRADLDEPCPKPEPESAGSESATTEPEALWEDNRLTARHRDRHAAVHDLLGQGFTRAAIARHLRLDPRTVNRFAQAGTVEELLAAPRHRSATTLDAHKPYLYQRWNNGVTDAAQLHAEITAHGYKGSKRTVRRALEPFRLTLTAPVPKPLPPTIREATRWITSHPDHLIETEKTKLNDFLDRSPHLNALADHVTTFAKMMTERTGRTNLKTWLAAVETDNLPALHSLARGIRSDQDAVTNGLSLPYSSGAVEGNVTRIKALKRSRYGRANLDLLRKLILCAH